MYINFFLIILYEGDQLMDKIIIIVPYFGKFPPMFKYWLKTAISNSTIDFLIFTDQNLKSQNNIKVVNMPFEEMKDYIQKKFEFDISLEKAYKLCDYRLAFGYIFEEYVKGYDFWGYCDVDMVLGDIRHMLGDKINNFDKFNYHGHLSLYRINSKANELWKIIETDKYSCNYQQVFTTPDSMYFDEYWGGYPKSLIAKINVYHDMNICVDPLQTENKFYKLVNGQLEQFVVLWKNNKLYKISKDGKNTEIIYAHFFRRKFDVESNNISDSFKIVPGKIIESNIVEQGDFDIQESKFYRYHYKLRTFKNSVNRYGISGTIKRRIFLKNMNKYHQRLEKLYKKV